MLVALHNTIDTSLLEVWYKKDYNAVPPVFQLQPITTHFPNYNNNEDATLRERDRAEWWLTFERIQKLIWQLTELSVEGTKMSAECAHKYFVSGRF